MNYKQLAIERFKNDIFATKTTGIEIKEVSENYAKCMLRINEDHMNAAGYVMGGVIFTLADFTFAIAANTPDYKAIVSLSSSIRYIKATTGPILYAETKHIENKKNICFYDIKVSDAQGILLASVSTTGYKK